MWTSLFGDDREFSRAQYKPQCASAPLFCLYEGLYTEFLDGVRKLP